MFRDIWTPNCERSFEDRINFLESIGVRLYTLDMKVCDTSDSIRELVLVINQIKKDFTNSVISYKYGNFYTLNGGGREVVLGIVHFSESSQFYGDVQSLASHLKIPLDASNINGCRNFKGLYGEIHLLDNRGPIIPGRDSPPYFCVLPGRDYVMQEAVQKRRQEILNLAETVSKSQ